jgi:K+-sensing histidine kinase KdpD
VAILCFASALGVHVIFRSVGGSLMFSTYFPAVLVAGLLAGLPAGIFVTVAALLTVWWAFMPPPFTFSPLALDQRLDLAAYLLSSGCILVMIESYRAALRQVRKHERERELMLKELEHRAGTPTPSSMPSCRRRSKISPNAQPSFPAEYGP